MSVILKHRARSRKGPRSCQEDCIFRIIYAGLSLLIVSDGMGGMENGRATAQAVIWAVLKAFLRRIKGNTNAFTLERIAKECALYAQVCGLRLHDTLEEPGATLLVAVANAQGEVGISWLGDSPAILQTDSGCRLLTKPHNVNADEVYRERTGAVSGDALTRFIGEHEHMLSPDSTNVTLKAGEALYLCTDGALPLFNNPEKEPPSIERFDNIPDAELTDNASVIQVFIEDDLDNEVKNPKEAVMEEPTIASPAVEADASDVSDIPLEPEEGKGGDSQINEDEKFCSLREANWHRQKLVLAPVYSRLPVAP